LQKHITLLTYLLSIPAVGLLVTSHDVE